MLTLNISFLLYNGSMSRGTAHLFVMCSHKNGLDQGRLLAGMLVYVSKRKPNSNGLNSKGFIHLMRSSEVGQLQIWLIQQFSNIAECSFYFPSPHSCLSGSQNGCCGSTSLQILVYKCSQAEKIASFHWFTFFQNV